MVLNWEGKNHDNILHVDRTQSSLLQVLHNLASSQVWCAFLLYAPCRLCFQWMKCPQSIYAYSWDLYHTCSIIPKVIFTDLVNPKWDQHFWQEIWSVKRKEKKRKDVTLIVREIWKRCYFVPSLLCIFPHQETGDMNWFDHLYNMVKIKD